MLEDTASKNQCSNLVDMAVSFGRCGMLGKAPQAVSTFMAGDRLVALNKNRDGSPPDVRPIVPLQFGVACRAGAEKIVHSLRNCIEEHWLEELNIANAFNLVSRLDGCPVLFPEILSYVSWYCGSHPELWHPMSHLSSQIGIQQGDRSPWTYAVFPSPSENWLPR
ncbi:hypothetical protein EMCRGX_G020438 [Ephydatia muelleri]